MTCRKKNSFKIKKKYLASSVHNNLVKSSACMTRVLVFSCWDLVTPDSTDEEDIGEETTAPAITKIWGKKFKQTDDEKIVNKRMNSKIELPTGGPENLKKSRPRNSSNQINQFHE